MIIFFLSQKLKKKKHTQIQLFLGKRKRMAMLDHLIAAQQNGEKIDDTGIREEVDTFIFEVISANILQLKLKFRK